MAEPLYPSVEEPEKRPLGFDAVADEAAGDPKSYTVQFTPSDEPKRTMAEEIPRTAEGAAGSEQIKLLDRRSEEEKVSFVVCVCVFISALDLRLRNSEVIFCFYLQPFHSLLCTVKTMGFVSKLHPPRSSPCSTDKQQKLPDIQKLPCENSNS